MKDPLQIPDGMTKEDIDMMTVSEGEWRENPSFVCADCGQTSVMHPYTNQIWGCENCGLSTYSVSVFFRPVAQKAVGE